MANFGLSKNQIFATNLNKTNFENLNDESKKDIFSFFYKHLHILDKSEIKSQLLNKTCKYIENLDDFKSDIGKIFNELEYFNKGDNKNLFSKFIKYVENKKSNDNDIENRLSKIINLKIDYEINKLNLIQLGYMNCFKESQEQIKSVLDTLDSFNNQLKLMRLNSLGNFEEMSNEANNILTVLDNSNDRKLNEKIYSNQLGFYDEFNKLIDGIKCMQNILEDYKNNKFENKKEKLEFYFDALGEIYKDLSNFYNILDKPVIDDFIKVDFEKTNFNSDVKDKFLENDENYFLGKKNNDNSHIETNENIFDFLNKNFLIWNNMIQNATYKDFKNTIAKKINKYIETLAVYEENGENGFTEIISDICKELKLGQINFEKWFNDHITDDTIKNQLRIIADLKISHELDKIECLQCFEDISVDWSKLVDVSFSLNNLKSNIDQNLNVGHYYNIFVAIYMDIINAYQILDEKDASFIKSEFLS